MPRKSSRNTQNQFSNGDCETNQCFDRQVEKLTRPGDTLWAKINGCSWWPAQVVEDNSISDKHKQKAEGEVLVRLYGTYEYLYVDAVKSRSEFANVRQKKLAQENRNSREAFQQALEEALSHAKSGCNSKRKASRYSGPVDSKIKRQKTSESSMGKSRKRENKSPPSSEAQTDNVKEVKSVRQRRGKSKEAFRDNNSRQYDFRKTKDRELQNVSTEKAEKNVSKEKESSATPKKRGKAVQEEKTKRDESKKRKACEASKENINEANASKKPNLAKRLRDRTSDVKTTMQDAVKPTVKAKSSAKASNSTRRQTQKLQVTKKAKIVVVDVKSSKQKVSTPAKGTSRTKSPISKKVADVEESMSIKMKVMQSLGLIAPSGSPFQRNRLTKGARRIF